MKEPTLGAQALDADKRDKYESQQNCRPNENPQCKFGKLAVVEHGKEYKCNDPDDQTEQLLFDEIKTVRQLLLRRIAARRIDHNHAEYG